MTQAELADKLGITDKAVSKRERNLSYPDINVDELLQGKMPTKNDTHLVNLVLKSISLAMSVATVVLFVMNEIEVNNAISMLAIGLICLTFNEFLK